jgi:hypothetical protein
VAEEHAATIESLKTELQHAQVMAYHTIRLDLRIYHRNGGHIVVIAELY